MGDEKTWEAIFDELENTSGEKTLDEPLDAIDKWSERLVADIKDLSPQEVAEHFKPIARPL